MGAVNRFDRTRSSRARAQLLIAVGVAFALVLVALTLALNTATHAQERGSEGAEIGGTDAAAFSSAVETEGQHVLEVANASDDVEATFRIGISEWNALTRRHSLARGVYTDVSVVDVAADGSRANLSVTYESARISYRSTRSVELGEHDG